MKLGLGIICKDEVEDVKRILDSYSRFFDEVHITVTNPERKDELFSAIEAGGGIPSYFEWCDDFSAARNYNKSLFKDSDYYLRMDCDDKMVGIQNIRKVGEHAVSEGINIVYFWYDYSKDEWGNTNAGHYREGLIKCTDNLYWNKPIHENVLPRDSKDHKIVIEESVKFDHQTTPEKAELSAIRNMKYLLDEYNRDKEKTDPRTIAYIGRVLMSVGDFGKAKVFLERHIEKSGWDEDRYLSWCQLSEIYKQEKDYKMAVACAMEALAERPEYPDAYLKLHDIYFDQELYEKAVLWGEAGMSKKAPKTFMLLDPSSYSWRPALSMAFSFFKLGQYDKASRIFSVVKKMVPTLPFVVENEKLFEDAVLHKRFVENFVWLFNFIRDKSPERIPALAEAIPEELHENELLAGIRNKFLAGKKWGSKSVVFVCGQVLEDWTPNSLDKGIGGSEEAVIHLSRELVRFGYDVTVFNNCGEGEGTYDGVAYKNLPRFNPRDEFNILISWRTNIFPLGIKAQKKIVWMHDVPHTLLEDKKNNFFIDKIVVLSEFHKSLISGKIEDEKIFVSSNGINLKEFDECNVPERNPKRVIYASSYDRGLEHLLEIWPEVKAEVPEAELHIFYGWNNYDKLFREGAVDGKFKEMLLPKLKQDGVFDHGRIGQGELVQEFFKAGVWAYPCHFDEISCITAMKAQACGAIPVVTGYAALNETVRSGIVIPGSASNPSVLGDFKNALIGILMDTEEQDRIRASVLKRRALFSWEAVAWDWHERLFLNLEPRTFIEDRLAWIRGHVSKNDKIVDIGGNDGHTFEGWDRSNITTVDIDLYDIPNFVRSDAHTLPFEDKSFDVAVFAEIIEHVEDPVKCLKEAARVAKRQLVITVPYEQEWPEHYDPMMSIAEKEKKEGKDRMTLALESNPKAKEIHTGDNLEHLWHHRHYDRTLLEEHLKLAGFEDYKIEKLVLNEWVFWGVLVNL